MVKGDTGLVESVRAALWHANQVRGLSWERIAAEVGHADGGNLHKLATGKAGLPRKGENRAALLRWAGMDAIAPAAASVVVDAVQADYEDALVAGARAYTRRVIETVTRQLLAHVRDPATPRDRVRDYAAAAHEAATQPAAAPAGRPKKRRAG